MSSLYINGVHILVPMDELSLESFIDNIICGNKIVTSNNIDLNSYSNRREFRRIDRMSMLALLCYEKLLEPYLETESDIENYGTIINTVFGPIETNVEFANSIVHGNPEAASPISFSHTVNNAALGHVCKKYKIKGPSTLLLSSNIIEVANNLILSKKAETIFACGLDQYFEELYCSLKERGFEVVETAVGLTLDMKKNDHTYCEIIGGYEENLGGHPYFQDNQIEFFRVENITFEVVHKSGLDPSHIRYFIINSAYEEIISEELRVAKLLNSNCEVINTGKCIGETLGATLLLNLAVAALLCKVGKISPEDGILVGSYDISGNYIAYIVTTSKD